MIFLIFLPCIFLCIHQRGGPNGLMFSFRDCGMENFISLLSCHLWELAVCLKVTPWRNGHVQTVWAFPFQIVSLFRIIWRSSVIEGWPGGSEWKPNLYWFEYDHVLSPTGKKIVMALRGEGVLKWMKRAERYLSCRIPTIVTKIAEDLQNFQNFLQTCSRVIWESQNKQWNYHFVLFRYCSTRLYQVLQTDAFSKTIINCKYNFPLELCFKKHNCFSQGAAWIRSKSSIDR